MGKAQNAACQVGYRILIGLLQRTTSVSGLYGEMAQITGGFYQRTTWERTAGQIGCQYQFAANRLCIKISAAVNHNTAYAALQTVWACAEICQQFIEGGIDSALVQRNDKENPGIMERF